MLKIDIKTIPHSKQRYDTIGDYFDGKCGSEHFRISEIGDWRMEFLVALHELVEKALCRNRGIKVKDIDAFDMQFEKERLRGLHGSQEPGDNINAPYRQEHFFATSVEKMVAHRLGVEWRTYNKALEKVCKQRGCPDKRN